MRRRSCRQSWGVAAEKPWSGAWGLGRQVPENIALYIYIYISHSTQQLTRGGSGGWEEATLRQGSGQREPLTGESWGHWPLTSSPFGLRGIQAGPCRGLQVWASPRAGTWGGEGGRRQDSKAPGSLGS